jgi:HK97 family phage major capsid protein
MEIEIKGLEGKELNPNHFGGMCSRQTVVLRKQEEKEFDFEKGIETIATTEAPAIVIDWENYRYIREVLLMKFCDLSGDDKVPFLDTHSRSSVHKILGSAFNFKTEGTELICDVSISSVETEVRTKIKEGHIDSVSLGYLTDEQKTIEIPKGKEIEIDGLKFKNDYQDGMPFIVRLWWKKKEVSAVPIGADEVAKFRAELQGKITSEDPELQKKLNDALNENTNLKNLNQDLNIKLNERGTTMDEKTVPTPDEIRSSELARIDGIEALAKSSIAKNYKFGAAKLEEKKIEAKQKNWSVNEFRAHIWDNHNDDKPVGDPSTKAGMSEKDIESFNFGGLIKATIAFKEGDLRAYDKFKVGKELEIITAVKEKVFLESGIDAKGLMLPFEIVSRSFGKQNLNQRALNVGTPSAGGYLVGTDHLGGEFIGLPRNTLVAGQLGCRMISGLKGNIDVPKQLTPGAFAWGSENFASVDTDLTLGQVTSSPKEGKASQTYGRKVFLQSEPNVGQIVMEDLNAIGKLAYDSAVINGAGGNAPTGVLNTSNIGDVVGGSLDWDALLEFESDIAIANLDSASLKFGTNPSVRAIMKGRLKSAGVSGYLMEGDTANGYPVVVSNQFPANTMVFGDWSKVWLLDWSMYDILINPYKDNTGNVTIVLFVYADVQVPLPPALTASDDIS